MIRFATKEDLPEISKLWIAMVKELKSKWHPDVKNWIKITSTLLDSDMHGIVIAIEDSKIVGFLEGIIFYDPAISKNRGIGQYFYVIPKYRNTKIAESLYEEILVQALKRNTESFELFCLPEKEEYWSKRGFVKTQIIMRMEI